MSRIPTHALAGRGCIVFFAGLFVLYVLQGTELLASVLTGLCAVLFVVFSILWADHYKKAQSLVLFLVSSILIMINHIHDKDGLLLLAVAVLMAVEYDYMRSRIGLKAAVAGGIVGAALAISATRSLHASVAIDASLFHWGRSLLFGLFALYQTLVLVFVPRVRIQRGAATLKGGDAFRAYHNMSEKDQRDLKALHDFLVWYRTPTERK